MITGALALTLEETSNLTTQEIRNNMTIQAWHRYEIDNDQIIIYYMQNTLQQVNRTSWEWIPTEIETNINREDLTYCTTHTRNTIRQCLNITINYPTIYTINTGEENISIQSTNQQALNIGIRNYREANEIITILNREQNIENNMRNIQREKITI